MKRAVSTSIVVLVMAALCRCTTVFLAHRGGYPLRWRSRSSIAPGGVDYEVIRIVSVDGLETEYGIVRLVRKNRAPWRHAIAHMQRQDLPEVRGYGFVSGPGRQDPPS